MKYLLILLLPLILMAQDPDLYLKLSGSTILGHRYEPTLGFDTIGPYIRLYVKGTSYYKYKWVDGSYVEMSQAEIDTHPQKVKLMRLKEDRETRASDVEDLKTTAIEKINASDKPAWEKKLFKLLVGDLRE